MKNNSAIKSLLFACLTVALFAIGCAAKQKPDPVKANIKMYTHVWDEIINKRKLNLFNDSNFTTNVVMHASPADVVGIDRMKAFYSNYLTGFSNVQFTIKDVFGQGDKLVKYWNFKGKQQAFFSVFQLREKL